MTTWKEIAEHYYHVAVWFCTHDPGTPVPDWCVLQFPKDTGKIEDFTEIEELIQLRIKDGQ